MAKQIKKIIPDTVEMPVGVLEQNAGQLEGVPANPRTIKKKKFEALKQSLKDDPEMLGYRPLMVYPHGEKYIIMGGNMRYAAAKALGLSTIPCIVLPESTTAEKLRAYAIKDNNGYGEWDWDMLANEWDEDLLKEWGLDLPMDAPIDADEVIDRASVGGHFLTTTTIQTIISQICTGRRLIQVSMTE